MLIQENKAARLGERHHAQRKLTDGQVREIRLSMEATRDLAIRYRVNKNTIIKTRNGSVNGPLRADERAAQAARENAFDPAVEAHFQTHHALVVTPDAAVPAIVHAQSLDRPVALATSLPVGSPFTIGSRFADDECKHGRLAGDRTPPCGCWPQEQTNPTPITRRTNGSDSSHADRLARFAAQADRAGADHGRSADDRAAVA